MKFIPFCLALCFATCLFSARSPLRKISGLNPRLRRILKGRGYVESGDRKAADFIADEFQKAADKKFGKKLFPALHNAGEFRFRVPCNSR